MANGHWSLGLDALHKQKTPAVQAGAEFTLDNKTAILRRRANGGKWSRQQARHRLAFESHVRDRGAESLVVFWGKLISAQCRR
jgi:hypothetical protein